MSAKCDALPEKIKQKLIEMIKLGVQWKHIEEIFKIPASTLRVWARKNNYRRETKSRDYATEADTVLDTANTIIRRLEESKADRLEEIMDANPVIPGYISDDKMTQITPLVVEEGLCRDSVVDDITDRKVCRMLAVASAQLIQNIHTYESQGLPEEKNARALYALANALDKSWKTYMSVRDIGQKTEGEVHEVVWRMSRNI